MIKERTSAAAITVAEAGQSQTSPRQPEPPTTLDASRTYAKATVQKTIRFHPKLIAELDGFNRQQELSGEKPLSFQQIQNEALELWIEQRVRQIVSNPG